jgi:hypothetical protein
MATTSTSTTNEAEAHRRLGSATGSRLSHFGHGFPSLCSAAALAGLVACELPAPSTSMEGNRAMGNTPIAVHPSAMLRIGTVDEWYLSYNVEMLEVTGVASGSPIPQRVGKHPTRRNPCQSRPL